jgi:hypothetical protein
VADRLYTPPMTCTAHDAYGFRMLEDLGGPSTVAAPIRHDDYEIGAVVLVARDAGVAPAEARVIANSADRPHIVKVKYLRSRAEARTVAPGSWACGRMVV